jgi:hypothetical protein
MLIDGYKELVFEEITQKDIYNSVKLHNTPFDYSMNNISLFSGNPYDKINESWYPMCFFVIIIDIAKELQTYRFPSSKILLPSKWIEKKKPKCTVIWDKILGIINNKIYPIIPIESEKLDKLEWELDMIISQKTSILFTQEAKPIFSPLIMALKTIPNNFYFIEFKEYIRCHHRNRNQYATQWIDTDPLPKASRATTLRQSKKMKQKRMISSALSIPLIKLKE